MSSSPSPIAHRAFTVLLAVLLVGGIVAPIGAAQPVAAQQDDTSAAEYVAVGAGSIGCVAQPVGCASGAALQSISTDQTSLDTKISAHSISKSEFESADAYHTLFGNYIEDTETIASVDARHAIATAYEQGNTTTEADSMARGAIRDYYTVHQKNELNYYTKQAAQLNQVQEVVSNDSNINDQFIHGAAVTDAMGDDSDGKEFSETRFVGLEEENATLQNGTEISYMVPQMEIDYTNNAYTTPKHATIRFQLDPIDDEVQDDGTVRATNDFELESSYYEKDQIEYVEHGGTIGVQNVPDAGLDSAIAFDMVDWHDLYYELKEQSNTVAGNYQDGFAQDLYDAMESGQVDPNEVRGIEGQLRHLTGDDDANVTDDRFEQATLTMLDIAQPDASQTSSMVVSYDGYTERSRNATDNGNIEYSGYVENQTYEGLLFSQEIPEGGFETGDTYNSTDLNGTVVMGDQVNGEQITFWKGNFTIESMYDGSGNEVNSTTWEKPSYDSYNSSEYLSYLNESTEAWKQAIQEENEGSSGGPVDPGDWLPDGVGAGGAVVGLVIVGGVFVVVVAVVFRRP